MTPQRAAGFGPPLSVDDALLVQQVVGHVLESQDRGVLPQLPWHFELSAQERQAIHVEWPLSSALWDDFDARRSLVAPVTDESNLMLPLCDLLLAHRASADPGLTVLANALACACLGSHHLWQDLGATGRDEVSRLLAVGFPALHDSNLRNLRWKRHLFLVLGAQLGKEDLHSPSATAATTTMRASHPLARRRSTHGPSSPQHTADHRRRALAQP